ncbi:MAG: Smr/MutS family protein [Bacteriovoracaceae bacterium]|nr:Smr/MutS family protein [Bacteriovoracaceae bacterium]
MKDSDSSSFKIPEWPLVLEKITAYFFFDCNKERLSIDDIPLPYKAIEASFDRIQFFQEYLIDEYTHSFATSLAPLDPQVSLPDLVGYLGKAGFLNIRDQNRLVLAWESALKLSKSSSRHLLNPVTNLLPQLQMNEVTKFLKEFRYLVTKDGIIDHSKHPELQQLTNHLYEQEDRLRKITQDLIRSEDWKNLLQYDGFDVLDERYVLPVRTDSYRVGLGIIISRSESGSTLFVEPHVCRDLAFKRLETLSRIKEITFQIENNFHKKLVSLSPEAAEAINSLLLFDEFLGKSRFCLSFGLSRPKIRDRAGFAFHDLFHPLIKNPVKNDVYIDSVHTALVISGPNTGGKTALLKAISLSYQLYLSGLFVPALHAELYPYQTLFFLANDLQDIGQGLSSFSGEVLTYLKLSERLSAHNLILVDEIFNSTGSDEASALTLSMIDNFNLRKQSHFILSTHHQLLKNLAGERPTVLSGSMGFDVAEMKPNYRFYQGVPGQSMAVEIFERLAQDNPYGKLIGEEARNLLDKKQVNYEKLVQQVAQKGRELDEMLQANRGKERDLMNREKSLEGIMKLRMNDEITRAKNRIEQITKEALEVLDLTKSGDIQRPKRAEDRLNDLKRNLEKEFGEANPTTPMEGEDSADILPVHMLRQGNIYYNTFLKKEVQLQSIDWRKRQAVVAKGSLTVTVPLNTFKKGTTTVNSFQQIRISVTRETERSFILDCRGMRLEEFQHTVEKSLGDLLSGDTPVLNVVHGHGDGVLKAWLRGYIGKHKDFKWSPSETGNDGETEVRLKD